MASTKETAAGRKPDGAARLEQSESRRKKDGSARVDDATPRPPAGRKDPTRSEGKDRSPREKADDQSIAEGGRVMGEERSARQKSAVRTEPRRDANKTQKVANRQTSNKTGVQSGSEKADSARRSPGPEPHVAPVGGAFGPGKGEHIAPLRTSRNVDKSPRPKRKAS